MPEVIEAAVRAGTPELAADTHRRLVDRTSVSGTDWALGLRRARRRSWWKISEPETLCVRDRARSVEHESGRISHARISSTASGCDVNADASKHGTHCGPRYDLF